MAALLEVKNLSIEFFDHELPERVVKDFDLILQSGDRVGIVGESGSGKSMSALAIAGLLNRHDMEKKGEILFDGKDLLTLKRHELRQYQGKDIAMIFQEPMTSLNPVKKIGWQVEESLRLHTDLSKEECKKKAIELLKEVELPNAEAVYYMYPHELSGGMRQRVMIAAAMICEPKILIADEPTTALDVTTQGQIIELMKQLNERRGTAILFISHDLSLVETLCNYVIVMKDGEIVESGSTKDIFNNPRCQYTKDLLAAVPICDI